MVIDDQDPDLLGNPGVAHTLPSDGNGIRARTRKPPSGAAPEGERSVQSPDALSKTPQAEVGGAIGNLLQDQTRCTTAIVMYCQRDRARTDVQTEHDCTRLRVTFDVRERLASGGVQHFGNL